MGLFDFFKKKEVKETVEESVKENTPPKKKNNTLLAMPMFNNNGYCNIKKLGEHLETFWGFKIEDMDRSGNNESVVFDIDGCTIGMVNIEMPIPSEEIENTAKYAYYWKTVLEDVKHHTSHAIVTMMAGNEKSTEQRAIIFSKVLSSILMISDDAIAIYKGMQTLLLSRDFYLNSVDTLKENELPLLNWVYFGLIPSEKGNSLYTYGMDVFDKQEMEILNSKQKLPDIMDYMTDICAYLIDKNQVFKDGDTFGRTADEKTKITASKGVYLEGETLKITL